MQENALIGLFGGTFNPIHNGHLQTVNALCQQIDLAQVNFIPAAIPPHKQTPSVSASHRLDMTRLACAPYAHFSVDDIELKRQNTSYSIDTILAYREKYPDAHLCWIMGADALLSFHFWHRYKDILKHCHLIVMRRPDWQINVKDAPRWWQIVYHAQALKHYKAGKILFVDTPLLPVSSSEIRHALANGLISNGQVKNARLEHRQAIDQLLPKAVLHYIFQNHLYQYDCE